MTKDRVLRVRIAAADKRRLVAAARHEHLALSQWARRLLLIAARPPKRAADAEELPAAKLGRAREPATA